MRCSIGFVAALVFAWLYGPPPSHAQAPGSTPTPTPSSERTRAEQPPRTAALDPRLETVEYDEAVRSALQEFKLEHWAEARILFSRAHAIRPNARTLRGLGLTCFESRHYVDAIEYIEQALVHPAQPLTPQMRQDLERLLVQARQFVTPARLVFSADFADVRIDDRAAQSLRRDSVVLLDPGTHEIHLTASGFESATRHVTVEGNVEIEIAFALTKVVAPAVIAAEPTTTPPSAATPPAVALPAPLPAPPSAAGANEHDNIAPWILVAASGAVAVTGGVFLGVAFSNKSSVEHPDSRRPVWKDVRSSYDSGRVFFPLSAVLITLGATGIAAGLAWKFWPEAESSPTVELQPGGLRVSGRL